MDLIEKNTLSNSGYQESIDIEKDSKMKTKLQPPIQTKKLKQEACKCHDNPCFTQDEEIILENARMEEDKSDFSKLSLVDVKENEVTNPVSEVEAIKTLECAPETSLEKKANLIQECICKKSNLIVPSSNSIIAERIIDQDVTKANRMHLADHTEPDQPERGGIYTHI